MTTCARPSFCVALSLRTKSPSTVSTTWSCRRGSYASPWSKLVSACFFFSSRRRHTRFSRDWSSDVCSSDLIASMYLALRDHAISGGQDGRLEASRDLPGGEAMNMLVPGGQRGYIGIGEHRPDRKSVV